MFLSAARNYSTCTTTPPIQNSEATPAETVTHPVIQQVEQLHATMTNLSSEKATLECANKVLATGISSLHVGSASISEALQDKLVTLQELQAKLEDISEQSACCVDQIQSNKASLMDTRRQYDTLVESFARHNEAMVTMQKNFKEFYYMLHRRSKKPFKVLLRRGVLPSGLSNLQPSELKALKIWFAIAAECAKVDSEPLKESIDSVYDFTLLRDLTVEINGNDRDIAVRPVIHQHQEACSTLWTQLRTHVNREQLLQRRKDPTPENIKRREHLALLDEFINQLPSNQGRRKEQNIYKTDALSEGIRAAWTVLIQNERLAQEIAEYTHAMISSTDQLEDTLKQKKSTETQIEKIEDDLRLQEKQFDVIVACQTVLSKKFHSLKSRLSDSQNDCKKQADKDLISNRQRLDDIKVEMRQALNALVWTPRAPHGVMTPEALQRVVQRHIVNNGALQTRLISQYSTLPAASTYEDELAFVTDLKDNVLPTLLSLNIKAAPIEMVIPHRSPIRGHTLSKASNTSNGYQQTPISETCVAFEALPTTRDAPPSYRVITHLYPRA